MGPGLRATWEEGLPEASLGWEEAPWRPQATAHSAAGNGLKCSPAWWSPGLSLGAQRKGLCICPGFWGSACLWGSEGLAVSAEGGCKA